MNAFISYSHQDSLMLDALHKHLAQLQRDRIITAWTDREIPAGGEFDSSISASLSTSKLFLALLSPDYIASNYCYELEFQNAMAMHERGEIVIVPVVVEPCDWHNTPFSKFKALPRDGKAISTWENRNTAFLDVIQNLRKLADSTGARDVIPKGAAAGIAPMSRNYKIKKDFDSIEKIEFIEKTFHDVVGYIKRYIDEIISLENIKARVQTDTTTTFECLLVNRYKIATEAQLRFAISTESQHPGFSRNDTGELVYRITKITTQSNSRTSDKRFQLAFDEYHLFWAQYDMYNRQDKKELDPKEIAETMWSEWLEAVEIF